MGRTDDRMYDMLNILQVEKLAFDLLHIKTYFTVHIGALNIFNIERSHTSLTFAPKSSQSCLNRLHCVGKDN